MSVFPFRKTGVSTECVSVNTCSHPLSRDTVVTRVSAGCVVLPASRNPVATRENGAHVAACSRTHASKMFLFLEQTVKSGPPSV